MARGTTITVASMYGKGGTNYLYGTEVDDVINVTKYMYSGSRSTNVIDIAGGNDTVRVSGYGMYGYGRNVIRGTTGNKFISVAAMNANYGNGSSNEIRLESSSSDTNTLSLGTVMSTKTGMNLVETRDSTDYINVNSISAYKYGTNTISLGNGSKYLNFKCNLLADGLSARNSLEFGIGDHVLNMERADAQNQGINNITTVAGDDKIWIKSVLMADGLHSENLISLGEGVHDIRIGQIYSSKGGANVIETEGQTKITVDKNVSTGGSLVIQTGSGDDVIDIKGGMWAEGGNNTIRTGEGNDHVSIGGLSANKADNVINLGEGNNYLYIYGHVNTCGCGTANNYISSGSGNDFIELYAYVGTYALNINTGAGYDTLSLKGDTATDFATRYQSWLVYSVDSSNLSWSNLGNMEVNIGDKFSLNKISWLTNIINQYNDKSADDHIDMTINADSWGSVFSLNHIFTAADESAINTVNLTGSHANQLNIRLTLKGNGYNNDKLFINGDDHDAVTFDSNWTQSAEKFTDTRTGLVYNEFHNSSNETVYVQDNISLSYV